MKFQNLYLEHVIILILVTILSDHTVQADIGKGKYLGCYYDEVQDTGKRSLPIVISGLHNVTLEMCAAACTGHDYYGCEYFRECYCGDYLDPSWKKPETDCSMPCDGNKSEICGGPLRLSTYQIPRIFYPPPGFYVYSLSTKSLVLLWRPHQSKFGILTYQVEQDGKIIGMNVKQQRFNVTNLQPDTQYMFRIIAINSTGSKSIPTDMRIAKTLLSSEQENETTIDRLLMQMTLDEKLDQCHGISTFHTPDIPRLGIPGFYMFDGSYGPRGGMLWPEGVGMGCTWDTNLQYRVGVSMGKDWRALNVNMGLGPMMNIVRDGRWGRAAEGWSEDPYLTSKMAVQSVKGLHSVGTIATSKHYTAYSTNSHNVKLSLRTLYEIYNQPFQAVVQEAGAWAIMSSYNQVNGTDMSAQRDVVQGILKEEWNYHGLVVSDWGATYDVPGAALGGLDISMPEADHFGSILKQLVLNGTVPIGYIDDKVRRVLRVKIKFGLLDSGYTPKAYPGNMYKNETRKLVFEAGQKVMVLGKNEGGILPLSPNKTRTIAVVGDFADKIRVGAPGSAQSEITPNIKPPPLSPRQAIVARVSSTVKVTDQWQNADQVVIVVGIDDHGEGSDRKNIGPLPNNQDSLVAQILASKPKDTVVIYTGGSFCTADAWSQAPGLIFALYPGLDQGPAMASILFGDYNPAGRLPISFPKTSDQVPSEFEIAQFEDVWEGRGYFYYDYHKLVPAFPFGHGLSYTTFSYDSIVITGPISGQWSVQVKISNTGHRLGEEVIQLYISQDKQTLPRRVKDLRGFARIGPISPGQQFMHTFTLSRNDLSYYDDRGPRSQHHWAVDPGTYTIKVGSSSRNLPLSSSLTVDKYTQY